MIDKTETENPVDLHEKIIENWMKKPATKEELNTINDIKEECMTKQGGVWYYDEDKAKSFLRSHVQREVEKALKCRTGCQNTGKPLCDDCIGEAGEEAIKKAVEKALARRDEDG